VSSAIQNFKLTIYYTDSEIISTNISENTLTLYRYNQTTTQWDKLATDGSFVLATGANTTNNFIFANLTNFSSYSAGGLLTQGAACNIDTDCNATCKNSFDTGSYCAVSTQCVYNGATYENGGTACDSNNLQTCTSGTWSSSSCTNGCSDGTCLATTTTTTTTTGGGGGGGGATKKDIEALQQALANITQAISGVTIDTLEIYQLLTIGETTTTSITLRNPKQEDVSIKIKLKGEAAQFIFTLERITIPAQDSRTLNLRIIVPDDAEPKTYTAELTLETADEKITIPIILEITKKLPEKIVDIKIQPLQRTLQPGDILTIQTDIFNLGIKQPLEITLTIELVDSEGTIIFSTDQNLSVKTATTTTHTIPLPKDLQTGTYTVIGRATYLHAGVEQHIESVAEIEVQKTVLEILRVFMFKKYGIVRIWQILMLIPILILSTYAYLEYKKAARKRRRYNFLIEYGTLPKRGTNTAHVGNIAETRIKAHIDLNKLQTHTIIAGATGSGKTVAAQTIIEEALNKNIAVIVFDPTAQWTG